MLVSREWLSQYVALPGQEAELADRLTMSGLNFEGSQPVGEDRQLDVEVTSNRSDCLSHIGVAREVSVLFGKALTVPDPQPAASGKPLSGEFDVSIECPELCYRFTARLIRGVRVGPSPPWLVKRLATVGLESINNIVDVSNYVMLECGQPLHAFDYDRLQGGRIIVREPRASETLLAINHTTYPLQPGMCVIADANRAVGLGGVMGGAETEVSSATRNILVEAAWFNPMCIRATARALNLHSAASFRFERTIDPEQIDWASRRCCELIMELAGGELAAGWIDCGQQPQPRAAIPFRASRLESVLGISVAEPRIHEILDGLGFARDGASSGGNGAGISFVPPGWRRDVTREIDLVEEVGRIHGYDQVPDDIDVPLAASVRSHRDRVTDRIRTALSAIGLDEAMTASLVPEKWSAAFSPWTDSPPLQASQPMLGVLDKASLNIGAVNLLRRSLIPSLLEVLRINESRQNESIELYELARVWLPRGSGLPDEPLKLGMICQREFFWLKGAIDSLVQFIAPGQVVDARSCDLALFDMTKAAELLVGGRTLGWLGEVSDPAREQFSIRHGATVAELDVGLLIELAAPVDLHTEVSLFPAVTRDFNFVVDESVRWSQLASTIRDVTGALLESLTYRETFRDEKRDGTGRKRILLTLVLRSHDETLSREQVDAVCQSMLDQCTAKHGAALV